MLTWLAMGGYAGYVWSSYALLSLGVVLLWVHARRVHQHVLRRLRA